MNLEKELYSVIRSAGFHTFWIYKNLSDKDFDFPIVVLNYIDREQHRILRGDNSHISGRLTVSIIGKTEEQVFGARDVLLDILLHSHNIQGLQFKQNTSIPIYDENTKTYGNQIDLDFFFFN